MPNREIVKLEKELKKLRDESDSSKLAGVLNKLAYACLHSDPHTSEAYALEAYDIAKEHGILEEQARSRMALGVFHLEAGDFNEALTHCHCAMEIYESLDDEQGIATVHSRLANIYFAQGLIDNALEHYHIALKKMQESDNGSDKLASYYFNIGVCYATLNKLKLALSFYKHAESVWEKSRDNTNLASLYNNIGTVFAKKGELDNARELFLKALDLCERIEEKKQQASTLGNLGSLHEDSGEYQAAFDYFVSSLELYEELGNKRGVAYSCCCAGGACSHLGRLDEAAEFAERGLSMTRELKVKDIEITCLKKITNLYEKKNDLKKALMFCRELNTCVKEHLNEKSIEKIATLQVQFETEKKEKEAEIYRLRNVELSTMNYQLREALVQVNKLQGMLPICANCKKIRDDDGYWQQIESYISEHSDTKFSHGLCPECMIKLYGKDYSIDQKQTAQGNS
ncbi:MAG: tetratricopeptide repeat protein [Candidatus Aegiribacteria sp.]|nr:tetratricopeptide repeat protein [Candidatus Aegiribacteria sp.]